MNVSELKKIIEDVVRKVVKEELSKISFSEKNTDVKLQETKKTITNFKSSLREDFVKNQERPKIKTGNPLLDLVLSETKGGIPQQDDISSGIDAIEHVPINEGLRQTHPQLHDAMTRDYSSFLKKVDNKAQK